MVQSIRITEKKQWRYLHGINTIHDVTLHTNYKNKDKELIKTNTKIGIHGARDRAAEDWEGRHPMFGCAGMSRETDD